MLVCILLVFSSVAHAAISTDRYEIAQDSLNVRMKVDAYKDVPLLVTNKLSQQLSFTLSAEGNASNYIQIASPSVVIPANEQREVNFTIFADVSGTHRGELTLIGSINEKIPINISVSEVVGVPVEAITIDIDAKDSAVIGKDIEYFVRVHNLLSNIPYNVTMHYAILRLADKSTNLTNESMDSSTEQLFINTSTVIHKKVRVPKNISQGEYVIVVEIEYGELFYEAKKRILVVVPFLEKKFLGIKIKWYLLVFILAGLGYGGWIWWKRYQEKKKRYKGQVDFKALPGPAERSVRLGKIAETNKDAFFEIDQLNMHTLIAGSTGGGKTVSAEVLIEECLLKNATVYVFDPTAQWSGFLRKCTSKKMLALYANFGMKPSEARAFNGNVHQMLDARQVIDLKKYWVPGEIHTFVINKLDPEDIDILVANTVKQVFDINLPESPVLKLMMIFDECHRLLPKFGGSGQGFMQIERGMREFRKWGVGLMLISQVLTDFIGETKANIANEIQMRTRDQGDLDRIKAKYGTGMLQSLLKAATGTGMFENASYNRGNPYFIAFRPLLHEHARLSDEELANYNKYNDNIDDIEYKIVQLEEKGIDVFDMKLELKMALDKVKSGQFNMVDIYLDGLTPRIEEQFTKLGVTPKEREIQFIDDTALQADIDKAKAEHDKIAQKEESDKAKEEETKEKPKKKEYTTLELEDGTKVNKPQELLDNLVTMDEEDVVKYVNDEKNVFADWVRPVSEDVAKELEAAKTKEDVLAAIEDNFEKLQ